MILALVSSGRSLSDASRRDEARSCRRSSRRRPARPSPSRPRAPLCRTRCARTVMHLLGVVRLDRGDRVAGVDRAGERVRALDREDVADLHHVEQRGDARGDVLAEGRGRREERVVAVHQLGARPARRPRRAGARGAAASATQDLARRRRSSPPPRRPRRRPLPATSRWTSPSFDAAVTVASVASLIALPSCSTRTRTSHFAIPRALQLARPARRPSRP